MRDLFVDLRDGASLLALLEVLSGERLVSQLVLRRVTLNLAPVVVTCDIPKLYRHKLPFNIPKLLTQLNEVVKLTGNGAYHLRKVGEYRFPLQFNYLVQETRFPPAVIPICSCSLFLTKHSQISEHVI